MLFISGCFICCGKEEEEPGPILLTCAEALPDWSIQCFPYPKDFGSNDLFFPGEQVGYSVGKAGLILKTVDSGNTWEIIHHRTFPDRVTELKLTAVYFINDEIGFVGGERRDFGDGDELDKGAAIFKTIDGGHSWSKSYFKDIQEFDDFIFFDQLNGISIATFENDSIHFVTKILSTKDGGTTWKEIVLPVTEINSDKFTITKNFLYVTARIGNTKNLMLLSSDKGKNWITKMLPEVECNRILFISDSVGYLACGLFFFPERIYKTVDQGNTWNPDETNPINSSSIVHFVSEEKGLVINGIYDLIQIGWEAHEVLASFELSETTDGGINWQTKKVVANCGFDGISFDLDSSTFYIMGDEFCRFKLK